LASTRSVIRARHARATLKIVKEGWSREQVQVFLGHKSWQTTARHYAHLRSTDAPVPAPIRGVAGGQRVAKRRTETGRDRRVAAGSESAG
jgi:hypothetical protein